MLRSFDDVKFTFRTALSFEELSCELDDFLLNVAVRLPELGVLVKGALPRPGFGMSELLILGLPILVLAIMVFPNLEPPIAVFPIEAPPKVMFNGAASSMELPGAFMLGTKD